jgi:hypothetical protein
MVKNCDGRNVVMAHEIPSAILAEAVVCPSCGRPRSVHYIKGKRVSYIIAWCETCRTENAWRSYRNNIWQQYEPGKAFRYASALVGRWERLG